ncbi:sensor histidine kinase [Microvirga pudoricolor]|uniref:sensor histidine kinase n=1 Tax=Microvirga pudoricolor TaxID=2778729 RepID=UPI00195090F3|nr:HAMP domain-containing sensor histidine kinase [Microvirga pudoricolor]MBM6593076.1 HAMP domain-containing histidine kinase [Microvirga pudoricolor]
MKDTLRHQASGEDAAPSASSPSMAELTARLDEMREALAARDAFLAVAAHELRNPMTPILAHAQRLRRLASQAENPGDLAGGLERLEKLIEHYVRRATVLLDVSRITMGKLRLSPEPFDLAELARHTVDALSPAAHYVGSTIAIEAPPELPCRLDRLAAEQILDNLISNAVKYGAGSPIEVRVACDGHWAKLQVADRGIGISEVDQQRIFNRFERAVAMGSKAGGFGVGLWVVGQLVDALGGRVEVDSQPGSGTTFTVRLPVGTAGAPHA